jgi:hypothetical protein
MNTKPRTWTDLLDNYRWITGRSSALANSLQHALSLLSQLCLHQLSFVNAFQHRSCLSFRAHVPIGLVAISRQPPTLLTAVSRLSLNRGYSSLDSRYTDRVENTASEYSILASYDMLRPFPSNGCYIAAYFAVVA